MTCFPSKERNPSRTAVRDPFANSTARIRSTVHALHICRGPRQSCVGGCQSLCEKGTFCFAFFLVGLCPADADGGIECGFRLRSVLTAAESRRYRQRTLIGGMLCECQWPGARTYQHSAMALIKNAIVAAQRQRTGPNGGWAAPTRGYSGSALALSRLRQRNPRRPTLQPAGQDAGNK